VIARILSHRSRAAKHADGRDVTRRFAVKEPRSIRFGSWSPLPAKAV
jgi:hypothetical protein